MPVSDKLPVLKVAFAGGSWNGKTIPAGQHCKKFGGNGSTPPLTVRGIPAGANAIIVEFNDEHFQPLSHDGGHGKVGFWISGREASLPPVPGNTNTMPSGAFLEAENQAIGAWTSPGYLPPCSGGQGNLYSAVVKAVYKAKTKAEASKLLAVGQIKLGTY